MIIVHAVLLLSACGRVLLEERDASTDASIDANDAAADEDGGIADVGLPTVSLHVVLEGAGSGSVLSGGGEIACPPACEATVLEGGSVTLTASPDGFSTFDGWSGDCAGIDACAVSMNQNRSLRAIFGVPPSPVVNGQAASLVLGQSDFTTSDRNRSGQSARSLQVPVACASDGTRLWVLDSANARVLQWNSEPAVNFTWSNVVIGQATFNASSPGTTQSIINTYGVGLGVENDRIFVADTIAHRILVWRPIPLENGEAARVLIGQNSWTENTPGRSSSLFRNPSGLAIAGGKLIVADQGNSRVLIWNTIPSISGTTQADVVLGQPDFESIIEPDPPTRSSLINPTDVHYDAASDRLFVSDTVNNRVMVWIGIPTTNGAPADYVIGQTGFENNHENAGSQTPNAIGLHGPESIHAAFGSLFIADGANQRVLVWTPIPRRSGEPATAVLGMTDFSIIPSHDDSADAVRLRRPGGICSFGSHLYVTDPYLHRVVRFDLDIGD